MQVAVTTFGNSIDNYVNRNETLLDHQEATLQKTKEVAEIYSQRFETIETGLKGIFEQIQTGLKEYQKTTAENLNQYLTEFSTTLTTAHQGLENTVGGLNDITQELTDQIDKMVNRR